jgi:MFS family permease
MALPMSTAILATSFAPERRGRVLGLFASAIAVGRMTAARLEDYGVLAAMLSSFGTAAGTIGMTITVALMEGAGGSRLWTDD